MFFKLDLYNYSKLLVICDSILCYTLTPHFLININNKIYNNNYYFIRLLEDAY